MFSPNLNNVQLKCKWLDSRNYLCGARGCAAMGDKISVYKHRKGVIYDVLFVRPCGDVDRFKVILVYLKRIMLIIRR